MSRINHGLNHLAVDEDMQHRPETPHISNNFTKTRHQVESEILLISLEPDSEVILAKWLALSLPEQTVFTDKT